MSADRIKPMITALSRLLEDRSVFVQSWAIVSLTILGLKHRARRQEIINKIKPLGHRQSKAIRTKVQKALGALERAEPIPTGWTGLSVLHLKKPAFTERVPTRNQSQVRRSSISRPPPAASRARDHDW